MLESPPYFLPISKSNHNLLNTFSTYSERPRQESTLNIFHSHLLKLKLRAQKKSGGQKIFSWCFAPELGPHFQFASYAYVEGLTIPNSGSGDGPGLGLPDTAPEDTILMSLAILGMSSSGRLSCGSLGKETCATVVWSLQKLPDAVCKQRNSNGVF